MLQLEAVAVAVEVVQPGGEALRAKSRLLWYSDLYLVALVSHLSKYDLALSMTSFAGICVLKAAFKIPLHRFILRRGISWATCVVTIYSKVRESAKQQLCACIDMPSGVIRQLWVRARNHPAS